MTEALVFCMAIDFGTSSPNTTCISVINVKATAKLTLCNNMGLSLNKGPNRGSIINANAGSPIQPKANEANVIPSCVALRYESNALVTFMASLAFLFP